MNFFYVYIQLTKLMLVLLSWPVGRVAHAEDCKSLYIGSIPVPASNKKIFRLSSAVEQSAVNRSVICSNQIVGAKNKTKPIVKTMGFAVIRGLFHPCDTADDKQKAC